MKKLKKLIAEKGYRLDKIASILNISRQSLSYRVNGKVPFSLEEVHKLCEFLKIPAKDIFTFFSKEEII